MINWIQNHQRRNKIILDEMISNATTRRVERVWAGPNNHLSSSDRFHVGVELCGGWDELARMDSTCFYIHKQIKRQLGYCVKTSPTMLGRIFYGSILSILEGFFYLIMIIPLFINEAFRWNPSPDWPPPSLATPLMHFLAGTWSFSYLKLENFQSINTLCVYWFWICAIKDLQFLKSDRKIVSAWARDGWIWFELKISDHLKLGLKS